MTRYAHVCVGEWGTSWKGQARMEARETGLEAPEIDQGAAGGGKHSSRSGGEGKKGMFVRF